MKFQLGDDQEFNIIVNFRPDYYHTNEWIIKSGEDSPDYANDVIGYGATIEKALKDYVDRLQSSKDSHERWGV